MERRGIRRTALVLAVVVTALVAATPASAQTLSPSSLTFGPQPFRTTSPAQTVTFTNTGAIPFPTEVYIQKPYDGGFFEKNTCPEPPGTVPMGGSCTITVTFAPYDPPVNTRSGTLFASQAGPSIPLTGKAVSSGGGKKKKCSKGKGKKSATAAKKKKCKKK
jgi:hypothetical protein